MTATARRVVTGHDANGRSIVLSDGVPPQNHTLAGAAIGADFIEMGSTSETVPIHTSEPAREPNDRSFTIMPAAGHLIRIIDIYPPRLGGKKTVMHRTRTLDYAMVVSGEIVLRLSDEELVLGPGEVVVQRSTDHAWENRSDTVARLAFFHIAGEFSDELMAKLPQPLELME
ncbi:MAG TPA: cupin domain-containing protein [Sphingomonadaceae bacterium]|nr:cupin domain-containing protein [Sphingomonadaceae bacterium]